MPSHNEDSGNFSENLKKDGSELFERVKRYPLISICFIIALLILIIIPHAQVDLQKVNNSTERADLENQYRATLAQILGGAAIGISLYYTWKRIGIAEEELRTTQGNLKVTQEIAQNSLKTSQEGQINERFTRAIDQLGNDKMEIRLGGIYALERISQESKIYYWPIMEILAAYVRKNSSNETIGNEKDTYLSMDIQANESKNRDISKIEGVSLDTQTILTVITKREFPHSYKKGKVLDLRKTHLEMADFQKAHLEGVNLEGAKLNRANLQEAYLERANLQEAYLEGTKLEEANLDRANLRRAKLVEANLDRAKLVGANLDGANLVRANLIGAKLEGAKLDRANLWEAKLVGANLDRAKLRWANLDWVILSEARLVKANLGMANLQEAYLKGANLQEAYLNRANIQEAYLEGANLEGANLEEADLRKARKLTIDQLSKVKTLYKAELDEGLRKQLEDKYPDKYQELTKKPEYCS